MPKFRVLTIDGGGVRGIIPSVWLSHLERRTGRKIHECFDLIVGTSGGSIVGAAAALDMDVSNSSNLYDEHGEEIFKKTSVNFGPLGKWKVLEVWANLLKPAYEEADLAIALKQVFGQSTALSECKVKFVVPSYDALGRAILLLRSFDERSSHVPVWEACKASSSAPTYFSAHELDIGGMIRPLIDGGVFANNPSMLAVSEALALKHSNGSPVRMNDIVLVSLGAGNMKRRISTEDAADWGSAKWVRPLLDVIFDGTSEMNHISAKSIFDSERYIRLQVQLDDARDDLDDASPANLQKLRAMAIGYTTSDEGERAFTQVVRMVSTSRRPKTIKDEEEAGL